MNTLLIISTIFFISYIVCFFIKNGIRELTLKQIIVLSGYQVKRCKTPHLIVLSTFSDLLLMFSVVILIISLNYLPVFVLIFGGLVIFILQKIIIFLITKVIHFLDN